MAAIATRAKLAIVRIITTVTGKTGTWSRTDLVHTGDVTAVTMNLGVSPIEFEL